jgi:hypothetical protein
MAAYAYPTADRLGNSLHKFSCLPKPFDKVGRLARSGEVFSRSFASLTIANERNTNLREQYAAALIGQNKAERGRKSWREGAATRPFKK